MMVNIRIIIRYMILLIASSAIGALLLITVYKLPVGRATQNVISSVNYLTSDFPNWTDNTATVSDGFTDFIMINTSIFNGRDNAVYYAMMNPHIEYQQNRYFQHDNLWNYLNQKENPIETYYSRYWHGYIIVLKPLLAFFTVQQIRLLNSVVQSLLLMLLLYFLGITVQKNRGLVLLGYGIAILSLSPYTIALCFQYSTLYYIILMSNLAIILFDKHLKRNNSYHLFFCFLGIMVAYFDFLTYPVAVLGFALTTYLLLKNNFCDNPNLRSDFIDICIKSILWFVGYGLMWASKWVLADILTGQGTVLNALETIKFRTSDSGLRDGFNLFQPISENLRLLCNPFLSIPLLTFSVIFIFTYCVKNKCLLTKSRGQYLYLFIASYPFIWCSVLRNHSVEHPYIVYRAFSVTVLGVFVFISQMLYPSSPPQAEQ